MSPDKELVRERFGRSLAGYDGEAAVQRGMAVELVEEILRHGGDGFDSALEIGCGTGLLSRELARRLAYPEIRRQRSRGRVRVPGGGRREAGGGSSVQLPPRGHREGSICPRPRSTWWRRTPSSIGWTTRRGCSSASPTRCGRAGSWRLRPSAPTTCARWPPLGEQGSATARPTRWLRWLNGAIASCSAGRVVRFCGSPPRGGSWNIFVAPGRTAWSGAGGRGARCAPSRKRYRERFGADDGVSLTYHPMLFVAQRRHDD